MHLLLIIALCLHITAAVFWAGSTFTLSRLSAEACGSLVRPQLAAAVVTILTGAFLWNALHGAAVGKTEIVLGSGAVAALLALALQALLVWPSLRAARGAIAMSRPAHGRAGFANQLAAALLLVTTVSMAAARFL